MIEDSRDACQICRVEVTPNLATPNFRGYAQDLNAHDVQAKNANAQAKKPMPTKEAWLLHVGVWEFRPLGVLVELGEK